MAVPGFQAFLIPLLEEYADGSEHTVRDLLPRLAARLHISAEDQKQLLPSGTQRVLDNRLHWAAWYLRKAELLHTGRRGVHEITGEGRRVLAEHPEGIDLAFLLQYPGVRNARHVGDVRVVAGPDAGVPLPTQDATLDDTLEATWQTLRDELARDLLDKVRSVSPPFFERLVIDVLVAMGYGGSRRDAAQAVGRTGDGGIDGIIKEDRLGLDAVYVQAKRWDGIVGRPVVQAFAGSLEGARARKGVLITTSTFSGDAQTYVKQIEKRIVLLDGPALIDLMMEHGVGVTTARTYEVKRLDSDYFEED